MSTTLSRLGGGRAAILLALVLAAAALPRLGRLGHEGLWCDEAYTANATRLPAAEMIRGLVTRDDAPPLFYLLERAAIALTGDSEAGLRLLPALAGVAAALLLWRDGRRRGAPASLWAAGFFATASYAVFHARQARSYGLLFLFALLLILACRDLLLENRRGAGWRLSLSGAALILTHNVGVVLLLTSLVLWVLRPARGGAPLGRWLLWHAIPLGIWILYWLASGQLGTHAASNVWMSQYWARHSLWLAPARSLLAFFPGLLIAGQTQVPLAVLPERLAAWRIVAILPALLVVVGLARCLLAGRGPARAATTAARAPDRVSARADLRGLAIEAAFLLAPLFALALASLLWAPTYVLGRTDAVAFPAAALLAGRALARLPRWAGASALALWTAISLIALSPTYGWSSAGRAKGSDRQVAAALARAGLAPSDAVVHTFLTAPSIDYYLHRQGRETRRVFFPSLAGLNPANTYQTPIDSLRAYEREARELRATLERELPQDASVWLFALLRGDPEAVAARPAGRMRSVTPDDLEYPLSLVLLALTGLEPQEVLVRYRQDWVSGDRVVVRVPRKAWIPLEQVPRVAAPAHGDRP